MPTFTHYLDLPVLTLIVALGALRPNSWTLFIFGVIVSVAIGIALTWWIPRLYPWGSCNDLQTSGAQPANNSDSSPD